MKDDRIKGHADFLPFEIGGDSEDPKCSVGGKKYLLGKGFAVVPAYTSKSMTPLSKL